MVALMGAFYIFDLEYPGECPGALYFLQEFVAKLPANKTLKYNTYSNACMGILSNKELGN